MLRPKQLAAFRSKATGILYGGAVGGRKSHLMRAALVVNLVTARALGLTVPVSLFTRADKVIE